jgi:capsular polysaccharide biosynthesis protein
VVEKLNLNVDWGKKYNGGMKLSTAEAAEFLRRRIMIRPVRNSQLLSITVFDEDRNEAARLANAITDTYRILCHDLREKAEGGKSTPLTATVTSMEVVSPAEPGLVPVMPDKPRNIVKGALMGIFWGTAIGGVSAYVVSLFRRNARSKPSGPDASGGNSFSRY